MTLLRFRSACSASDGASTITWSSSRQAARRDSLPTPEEPSAWKVIWAAGGLCWLIVACTALLLRLPEAGTSANGVYYISTGARALQHLLLFLAAAVGYRGALVLGWPDTLWERVWATLVNILLALTVVALAPVVLALVAGFVDGHYADMRDTLAAWTPPVHRKFWVTSLQYFLAPYILGLCAIALVLVARRQHHAALHAAELASAFTTARMAVLSAQLQPHFLFNTLHAVSELIDQSPREATTMLARLGDFLRHVLESSQRPWVDMKTELEGLEAYLAVQQTRYSNCLHIVIDAAPESLGIYVPSLLLQPLAENAVEYGRKESAPTLQVRVATSVVAGRLCIAVNNSKPQLTANLSPSEYGHGLSNVELRLRAAYGDDARLTIGPDQRGGTTAFLDLPLRGVAGNKWMEPDPS